MRNHPLFVIVSLALAIALAPPTARAKRADGPVLAGQEEAAKAAPEPARPLPDAEEAPSSPRAARSVASEALKAAPGKSAKPASAKAAPKPAELVGAASARNRPSDAPPKPELETKAAPTSETNTRKAERTGDTKTAGSEKPATAEKPAKLAKTVRAKKPEAPCLSPEVHVVRNRAGELEHRDLHLTFCDGTPNPGALDSISVLARPRNVERPLLPEIKAYQRRSLDRGPATRRRKADYLTELVMRVHPDLAVRLQKIALRFPGKTIEIISGHRPDARFTSRHHHGRALDVHVEGVSREALRDYLRTLDQTGVGYYPNGYFVHVDVRDDRGYWIDRSGPGEAADYGQWPPPRQDIERDQAKLVARAVAELGALNEPIAPGAEPEDDSERDARPRADAPSARDEALTMHEDDELTRDEVERIKAEALRSLEGLE